MIQNRWDAAKVVTRGIYSNTGQPQEPRNISNKQPNLTPKGARKIT